MVTDWLCTISRIKNSFEGRSLGAMLCRSSGDSVWVEMHAAVDQKMEKMDRKRDMEVARVLCIAVSHKIRYYRSHNGHVKKQSCKKQGSILGSGGC